MERELLGGIAAITLLCLAILIGGAGDDGGRSALVDLVPSVLIAR